MEYHLLEIIPSLEIITLSKILITFEIHFENFTFTSNKEHTLCSMIYLNEFFKLQVFQKKKNRCILTTQSAKETIDERKSCDLNSVNEIRKLETSYWLVW